jgi:hypothetical protein
MLDSSDIQEYGTKQASRIASCFIGIHWHAPIIPEVSRNIPPIKGQQTYRYLLWLPSHGFPKVLATYFPRPDISDSFGVTYVKYFYSEFCFPTILVLSSMTVYWLSLMIPFPQFLFTLL